MHGAGALESGRLCLPKALGPRPAPASRFSSGRLDLCCCKMGPSQLCLGVPGGLTTQGSHPRAWLAIFRGESLLNCGIPSFIHPLTHSNSLGTGNPA